jgi:hypothetical protein
MPDIKPDPLSDLCWHELLTLAIEMRDEIKAMRIQAESISTDLEVTRFRAQSIINRANVTLDEIAKEKGN